MGLCKHRADIRIMDAAGLDVPVQVGVLDGWPDGSIRWALLDLKLNVPGQYALHIAVVPGAMMALAMLHFFIIRRQKGLLPYL